MSTSTMSKSEREAFLAAVRVGIFTVADGDRGPIAVPVWYAYEPGGDVLINTGKASPKAKLAAATGRITLCVQDEAPPYGYVSVEGPVTFEPTRLEDVVALANRYLPPPAAKMYLAPMTKEGVETTSVMIRLKPETWRTVDYSKQYAM